MRREDSHDIYGTYAVCSDREEMSRIATSSEEFIEILKSRHAPIMQARTEKLPGRFKINANRAGYTYFVKPKEVISTLEVGFQQLAGTEGLPLAESAAGGELCF